MQSEPLVSIVIPAYNCSKTIKKTINSVLEQTYQNWELIVIDDCSTDNTYDILNSFKMWDKKINILQNSINIGVAKTRSKGIDRSKGVYIAFLDSDDIWKQEKLEKQIKLMEETSAVITCTSYSFIDEMDNYLPNKVIVPLTIDIDLLSKRNIIGCSTVVLRNNVARKYKMGEKYFHEDYVTWLRIVKEHELVYCLDSTLTEYRYVKGSKSHNKIKSGLNLYPVYRNILGMNPIRAICKMAGYFFYGLKKYNKLILK